MTLSPTPRPRTFADRAQLAAAASGFLEAALREGLRTRGQGRLLASGGSTPGPAYTLLSQADLDFSRIHIGLADERFVPADDAASNFALVQRCMAGAPGAQARLTPLYRAGMTPQEAATLAGHEMADLIANADAIVLGMGPDGHSLSWFAGAQGLEDALNPHSPALVTAIIAPQTPVTGVHTTRLTLTARAVSQVRNSLLLITGADKLAIWTDPARAHPVHHLIPLLGDRLTVYWAP